MLHHVITRPDPADGADFDAEITWRAVAAAIRELTGLDIAVHAVGVSAHLATVLVDESGTAAGRALLWRDNSARREAQELGAEFGATLPAITGRPPNAESTAARMRKLSRSDPSLLSRVRWILSLKDFLVLRLTGAVCTDPSSASYAQLFDVRRRQWSGRLADACRVPLRSLPPVLSGVSAAGGITPAAAEQTGLPAGVPVAVGGPDGSIGALGAGACRPGVTVDIAGTTDVLLHMTDAPPEALDGGVILNANLLDGLWAIGGPTGLTGGGLAWLTAILGYPSVGAAYEALGRDLDSADPGDLMVQTVLTGRRFPDWNSSLRGRIDGISAEHGPGHLLRAAEEGSVFEVRLGLDAIRATGVTIAGVIIAGMCASTDRMMQLRADVLGVPVGTANDAHVSLRGAAIAAGLAAGVFGDAAEAVAAMVAEARWYRPVLASMVRVEQRYQRWRGIMARS